MPKIDKRTGCVRIEKRKATIYDAPAFDPNQKKRRRALEKQQRLLLKGVKELVELGG